jgi:hypothetical protein
LLSLSPLAERKWLDRYAAAADIIAARRRR